MSNSIPWGIFILKSQSCQLNKTNPKNRILIWDQEKKERYRSHGPLEEKEIDFFFGLYLALSTPQ